MRSPEQIIPLSDTRYWIACVYTDVVWNSSGIAWVKDRTIGIWLGVASPSTPLELMTAASVREITRDEARRVTGLWCYERQSD